MKKNRKGGMKIPASHHLPLSPLYFPIPKSPFSPRFVNKLSLSKSLPCTSIKLVLYTVKKDPKEPTVLFHALNLCFISNSIPLFRHRFNSKAPPWPCSPSANPKYRSQLPPYHYWRTTKASSSSTILHIILHFHHYHLQFRPAIWPAIHHKGLTARAKTIQLKISASCLPYTSSSSCNWSSHDAIICTTTISNHQPSPKC